MHLFAAYRYKLRIMKQLFCLVLRKEKLKKIIYYFRALSIFKSMIYSIPGGKKTYLLLLWTVFGGREGYQAWQELCCVCLEFVCHECLGQSGIWTSFDGELWHSFHKIHKKLFTLFDPVQAFGNVTHSCSQCYPYIQRIFTATAPRTVQSISCDVRLVVCVCVYVCPIWKRVKCQSLKFTTTVLGQGLGS